MSAIAAVCGEKVAHVLTDAAYARQRDGCLVAVARKQRVAGRVIVACPGLLAPLVDFARLAEQRAPSYDALTAVAPELWEEACVGLSPAERAIPYTLVLAGWSDEHDRMAMDLLTEVGNMRDGVAWAAGPADECKPEQAEFITRFGENPDSFDPQRAGVALFERWRRTCPREYDDGKHTAIGGYMQYTIVTREGIESRILRHWPDIINRCIDPDAQVDSDKTYDANWPGQTLAQIFEMREGLVMGQSVTFGAQDAEAA